jgi:hypothetical protein
VVAAEYPKLHAQFNHGRWLHDLGNQLAVEENDAELKRLAEKRDLKLHKNSESLEREIYSLKERLKQDLAQCRAEIADQKRSASEQLSLSLDQTNRIFSQRIDSERAQAAANKTQLTASWEQQSREKLMRLEELRRSGASRMEGAVAKALQVVSRSKQWCDEHFPSWPHLAKHVEQWPEEPEVLCLPVADLSIDGLFPNKTVSLANNASLQSPIFFSPLRDGYLVVTGDPSDPAIVSTLRSIVVRALTSLPAGKAQVCIIDPPGMGRDFGWLLHLADVDPQLVTHRVWTQTTHIGNQLSTLALAAEDFIQQSLRNQYADIASYNREAGALAEPYRVLVWSSLPAGLDDHGWRSLRSLLESGARCGIFPILVVDPNLTWPSDEARTFVYRRGMHLTFDSQSREFILDSQAIQGLRIVPTVPPDHVETQHIIQEIGRRAVRASRVEVPLDSIVASGEQLWQGDSSHGLDIPIGQSGVGRSHSLRLGVGTAQHAIIAGKTGSGKSSLLHALITSAALKYSPESLRMVLLDFKKGVEFQLYADTELPHTDIIGIESHREFGLSALESIDSWMQRRGEAFRQAGVQNVASWNALHPEIPMPRVLLVIDEFQELFVEDDRLSSQASLILDRIVRQGRSFGVHAVLSSQTLAGSYSLPRTTLGQMSVRIALQCDASDAQIIFSEDNPAASRLKFPGQAVYNDAGGRIEGNQPMQIGWLSQTEQKQWFSKLELVYRNSDSTTNRLGRCVVYDGNRAAAWDNANADLALMNARKESNPDAMWCVVGESVAISPAVVFPLTRQAGRNALVVGGDDARAAATLNAITASFVKAWYSKVGPATSLPARLERVRPEVFVFQGAKPTDTHTLRLPEIWQQFDCNLHVSDTRECDVALARVYELLQKRLEDKEDEKASAPVLVHFLQIGRLRSLRRDDEYGLGSFGEANISPDKQLEEILRDGPSHGIHVMIWADSYSTVNRWLSRSALREMDLRILMQMSSSDSTNLIESIAASRLGDHVMLLFDEAIGQEQRFRPFDVASLGDLSPWAATP